ncbi:MAG: hypothetical protein MJ142_00730 [Clostridia bacterium]|nr:hypothetical protein [Clostridia bacterium]
MDFIANNILLIICFIGGVAMLVMEAFMPGFGVPGTIGILLEIAAIAVAWYSHGAVAALIVTLAALVLIAIAISVSLRSATKGKLNKHFVLNDVENADEEDSDISVFMGREGIAVSALRPAGTAEFDGVRMEVTCLDGLAAKGQKVRVISTQNGKITVNPV